VLPTEQGLAARTEVPWGAGRGSWAAGLGEEEQRQKDKMTVCKSVCSFQTPLHLFWFQMLIEMIFE